MLENVYANEEDLETNPRQSAEIAEDTPVPLRIFKIYTSPHKGEPMVEQKEITVIEGKGIIGDRYYLDSFDGYFDNHNVPNSERVITLISLEGIERGNKTIQEKGGTPMKPEETRRNLVVNVDVDTLDALIGEEFEVGGIRMKGVAASTPCWRPPTLAGRVEDTVPFIHGFLHNGGIRAIPLTSGLIREGDPIIFPKTESP